MRFAFYTLGCKVNQYETQAMEHELLAQGHTLGAWTEPCDAFIINTCTVTAVSDKKSRNMIRRVRKGNPDAVIGVCGCYAQTTPEDIRKLSVDVIAGTADRMEFLDAVIQKLARRDGERRELLERATLHRSFEVLPAGGLTARTRAMLKVQDGCNNFCTYCIIPYARGPIRSLALNKAVEQAKAVAAEGYMEIIVTGIEISSWGVDLGDGSALADLLEAICAAVPRVRIRLGSLEPRTITREFCARISRFSNLCPQFHLSLQSGSNTVLRRMNRKYDTARYYESVRLLREYFPGCAMTTDLIIAFPGETEEEFRESLSFLDCCAFADVHIFPFSKRSGTPAATMPGQHSNETKMARAATANALAASLKRRYHQSLLGSIQRVLFEQPEEEGFAGHAMNYVKVFVEGENLHNQVRAVEITGVTEGAVLGKLL